MVKYQDILKAHLAEYKRSHLGISEPGIFSRGGRSVEHHHILPIAQGVLNILEEAKPAASDFFARYPTKRHTDFHHLNSSQAFTFNLFFPFFSGQPAAASSLLRALGQEGELVDWKAEAVPDADEQSNIDMIWITTDGVTTFCEVKLSEAKFGTAAYDDRHLEKLSKTYRPVLEGYLESGRLEASEFFKTYQCHRNLWHMVKTERSRLVFLLPRANTALWPQLDYFLKGITGPTRTRVSAVAIEDVIARLASDNLCPENLRAYVNKLARKYLIDSTLKKNI